MFTLKEAQLPGRTVRCSIPRTRTVRVVARAGRRNVDEEETEKQGGGLFGGLIGRGTQKLKAGQQDAESGPKGRQAKPSRGTKVLKNTPSRQGRGPGGFLQFLGTQAGGRKDSNTVFVAGATGRLGLRIVRELLLAGFKVRAGARNTERAQEYADLATGLGLLPADAAKRLQVVEVDLEDEDTIVAAIGNAGKVVQAIGAAENNVLDFGAPKRIDGNAAIALVEAAKQVGVEQYVMVTSLGTGKFGWPAAALNLFGGILVQKRRAEKYLEQSGLQYVIMRPGGMEKPTDDYKRTNNVRLQTRDKLFGGQVSRLQVAELISAAVANPELASNKILEVVAETEAPLLDYEMLLQQHPSEGEEQEVEDEDEDEVEEIPTPAPVASRRRKPAPQTAQPVQAEVVPEKPKGRWGFPSKQQEGIAEGIAKKEINLKLGKEDPTPSKQEQRLAEDIAKKEIAIASGQEEPVNKGFFGRFMGGQQAKKEAPKPASRPEAPKAVAQEQQPAAAAQPALKPKKRETSQEELQRLESGRQKTSEVRASREADFLARLEQERTQEAQKKAQAAEKKAAEARKKLQEERQAKAAKLAAASKAAEEEAAASAKKVKAAAPAPAAAPKPKADSGDAKQALAKANDNAKEARKWIDTWRAEQQGGKAGSPASNGAAPKAASKAAPKAASKAAPKAAAGSQGKSDVPPNVAEAKEWIREWRAKSLETKLPQNTPANK